MKHVSKIDNYDLNTIKLPKTIKIQDKEYNLESVNKVIPNHPLLSNMVYNLHNNIRNVVRRYIMLRDRDGNPEMLEELENYILKLMDVKDDLVNNKILYT